jgi:hypothetical protein
MTIHQNFIFYEWILTETLSRLTSSGVSVASAALVLTPPRSVGYGSVRAPCLLDYLQQAALVRFLGNWRAQWSASSEARLGDDQHQLDSGCKSIAPWPRRGCRNAVSDPR